MKPPFSPESVGQIIRTVKQEEALLFLMPEARTAYRIGESLGIPPGTLQPMMRTLVDMGFVERLDDPQIRDLGAGRQTVARPYTITPEAAPGITTYFEEKALRILLGLRALNPGRRI